MFQEIFGINDNMRGLAERLAGEGYVVLVPDMFWRLQRRFESKDESGMGEGIALVQQLDMGLAMADMQAAHAHLLAMPECTGRIGAVGFCLGGGLAFACAATSRVDGRGPDAAVAYYGSHVNALLHLAEQVECPVMYHYGDSRRLHPAGEHRRRREGGGRLAGRGVPPLRRRPRVQQLRRPVRSTSRRPPSRPGPARSSSSTATWEPGPAAGRARVR